MTRFVSTAVGFALFLGIGACGSGTDVSTVLRRPVAVQASSADIAFDNRTTRFAYVADEIGGVVVVLDQDQENVVDVDRLDEAENTPLAVGGAPTALALDEANGRKRLFVADAANRDVVAFDVAGPSDPTLRELTFSPVDLGGAAVGRASLPFFINRGRQSSPAISPVTVDPALAQNESWELKYLNEQLGYEVTGSRSGRQVNHALEGQNYVSDTGAITFTVRAGRELANSDDLFRFGTVVVKPYDLGGRRPVDLLVRDGRLFITTVDPAALVIMDLETLGTVAEIALDDGSGTPVDPGLGAYTAGHLYVPNQANGTVFDIDPVAGTVLQIITTGFAARSAALSTNAQTLFLIPTGDRSVRTWDLLGGAVGGDIRVSDWATGMATYDQAGTQFGLAPLVSGAIGLLNLDSRVQVDTRITGDGVESRATGSTFSDLPPTSGPTLVSVSPVDGVARSERWQLVFEGAALSTKAAMVTISGDTVTLAGGGLEAGGVAAGDRVVMDPLGRAEELEISEVISDGQLRLVSAPSSTDSVDLEIRPNGQYVVFGSISGLQRARVREGEPYTSDDGAIALTIRGSVLDPTSRGDYFTFLVQDGITAIGTGDKRLARGIAVFTPPGRTVPTAYVAEEGSAAISVLDLADLSERRTIR